jgi:hypothetical protein
MKTRRFTVALAVVTSVAFAGCKAKTEDSKGNYKSAIDTYYASKPECLWAQPLKLPVQVDASDTSKTMGFDALVDQGMLQRTTDEKKRFLIGSKQVTNYDLSDKGRSAWTADQQMPGFGNFCYGTPVVDTIDSSTATSGQPGATTVVNYHAKMNGVPAWGQATETRNAFPQVQTDLAGPVAASATLTDTDHGWVVTTGPQGSSPAKVTNADGSIVQ